MLKWNPEIKLSDLLTVASVLVAAATLLGAWIKDRRLRKREYADRVRQASARALAQLERWREIGLALHDDIQPLITDTDALLASTQNVVGTRDFLWRGLVDAAAKTSSLIAQENVQGAYVELYAYDVSFYALYNRAAAALRITHERFRSALLDRTQATVIATKGSTTPVESAQLGNALREVASWASDRFAAEADLAIDLFRRTVLDLVAASDDDIVRKRAVRIDRGLTSMPVHTEDAAPPNIGLQPTAAHELTSRRG